MVLPTEADKNNPPDVSRYHTTFPVVMTMCAFMTIALYNVIDLHFIIFLTFKNKWKGLYFWSFLLSSWGVVINGLGVVFEFFQFAETKQQLVPILFFLIFGWYLMVTGQSLVLYSRLHILVLDARVLRGVLIMIIVDAVILHIPNTISIFLNNLLPGSHPAINQWYLTYEPLQLTVFAVQELIISGLYIFRTVKVLKASERFRGTPARKTLMNLIYINVFIIIMDITLVAMQFAGYDALQHFYKPAVYSVKLKLEFAILNQLVNVMRSGNPSGSGGEGTYGSYSHPKYGSRWTSGVGVGSKYLHGNTVDNEDRGYETLAVGNDNKISKDNSNTIPLSDISKKGGVTKTTEVAISHEPSSGSGDEGTAAGHLKPRSLSQSSSQDPFARSSS